MFESSLADEKDSTDKCLSLFYRIRNDYAVMYHYTIPLSNQTNKNHDEEVLNTIFSLNYINAYDLIKKNYFEKK